MFTIDQIKAAHSKVKSGADFPNYVRDLIKLGVTGYETFVSDGHTQYYGRNGFKVASDAKYDSLNVEQTCDAEFFKSELIAHQQGKTTYLEFCQACAKSGIEKWVVDMAEMTCTYFDKSDNEILVEKIP